MDYFTIFLTAVLTASGEAPLTLIFSFTSGLVDFFFVTIFSYPNSA